MRDVAEELADNTNPAVALFVEIDMIGCLEPVHSEVRDYPIDSQLAEDFVTKIFIELIIFRNMSKIFHAGMPFLVKR